MASIAVIGCGGWGKNIVRTLGELNALGAIYDANPDNTHARELAVRFDAPFRSAPDGLAQAIKDGFSAVAIATTDRNHANAVAVALRHGLDVFVEKPLSLNAHEAAELLNQAASRGKVLMVGHLLRYHPSFIGVQHAVSRLLDSHSEAYISAIKSIRHDTIEVPRDSDIIAGYAPHDISMVVGLLEDKLPLHETNLTDKNTISARLISHAGNPHRHIEAKLLAAKTEVTLDLAWNQPLRRELAVTIQTPNAQSLGTVVWSDEFTVRTIGADGTDSKELITQSPPLTAELAHYISCIEMRRLPLTSGEETRRVTELLELLDHAYFPTADNPTSLR